MPKNKFEGIYRDLKRRIEDGTYMIRDLIPSENVLAEEFSCSRNTVRNAIDLLAENGYVQTIHGQGSRVIYLPQTVSDHQRAGFETYREAFRQGDVDLKTRVLLFEETTVPLEKAYELALPAGEPVYHIERLRIIDGEPQVIEHNWFLRSIARGLTKEIAEESIYGYLEDELNVHIVTLKRLITMERANEQDEAEMDLGGFNCVTASHNFVFDDQGILFESTIGRHNPSSISIVQVSRRQRR